MTQKGQPFLFDSNVFDPEDPRFVPADRKKPKLEYTQEQIAQAKDSAFETGKIAGFKESQTSLMQDIQKIVQKIDRDTATLFAQESQRQTLFEAEAVHLALQLFRKVFKTYSETHGTAEMERILREALDAHREENIIAIEVHPALEPELKTFIAARPSGAQNNIMVKSNPALGKLECKLLWNNGGITYDVKKIKDRIDKTLAESLAVYNISVHDQDDSDKPENQENEG